ncbi:MAG: ATP-dependent RNA helicase RhlB, partial [Gammaproteobacteria bacterium]
MHQHLTDVAFKDLDLHPLLLQGLEAAGLAFCTPIQAQALPLALAGTDVEGQAQTGTGKTAAFLLTTMNCLLRDPPPQQHQDGQPRALIVAPTRELAVQIQKDAEVLGKFTGLRSGVVFGGTGYDSQREMLIRGLDILIGTPGRLIDYFKQNIFNLKSIQVAVVDEADRMFDLGFIRDIRYLLRRMPPPEQRLNMLFSATLSMRVSELAYEHMNSPTVVNANPERVTVSKIQQVLYHVSREDKIPLLVSLLRHMDALRTIVFTNTKRAAETVAGYLEGNGLRSAMLTGDVPQNKRLKLLEQFKSGELPVLVATDVAARGLHIPDVSHVFNFDLPQDAEDYVHRVGRTARAGASGDAVSFACDQYVYSLMDIEAFIGHALPTAPVEEDMLKVELRPPVRMFSRRRPSGERPRSGGRRRRSGGGRSSG